MNKHHRFIPALRTVLLACLLTAGAPGTRAEEGRIPIFEAVVLDGSTADISGQYVLTRDVTAPDVASTRVLEIIGTGVEKIEIDLNGFSLTTNTLSDDAVVVTNVKSFELRNGSVVAANASADLVSVSVAGADGKAILEDLKLSAGEYSVRLLGVPNFIVRRNLTSNASITAISVESGSFPTTTVFQGAIEDNVLRDENAAAGGTFGISVFHPTDGLVVRSNTIQAGFTGMSVSGAGGAAAGCLIADNYVAGDVQLGFNIIGANSCHIQGNRVQSAGQTGMQLFNVHDSLVTDNVVRDSGFKGIYVTSGSSGNLLERNIAHNNSNRGIEFDFGTTDNRYGRNSAYGNGGGTCNNSGVATCGPPDLCDNGTGNISFLDNLIPGPPPC